MTLHVTVAEEQGQIVVREESCTLRVVLLLLPGNLSSSSLLRVRPSSLTTRRSRGLCSEDSSPPILRSSVVSWVTYSDNDLLFTFH